MDFKEVEASLFSLEDIKKLLSIGRSGERVVLQVLLDDASKQVECLLFCYQRIASNQIGIETISNILIPRI